MYLDISYHCVLPRRIPNRYRTTMNLNKRSNPITTLLDEPTEFLFYLRQYIFETRIVSFLIGYLR